MHDTHTRALPSSPAATIPQLRPRLLTLVYQRWVFFSLLVIYLQFSTGLARADEGPGSGVLMLHGADKAYAALQLDAAIDLSVQGLLADMTLTQSFQNTTDQWVEGSYLFPLPPDAAVRALRIDVAGRLIKGVIKPRQQASEIYETAKASGKIAAVVEQQRPNLFTMKVANIAPGDRIDVTLELMLPVTVRDRKMRISLPMTLTPRYSNPATVDAAVLDTPFVLPEQLRGPRLDATVRIAPLDDYAKVYSSTHELNYSATGIQLTQLPMNKDLIINWPLPFDQSTLTHAFVSKHNNKRYVQLLISPPESATEQKRLARELILVIDKSGSMAGVSMDAARQALHSAIDELESDDYFNIVAFDNESYPMQPSSIPATDSAKSQARRFINRLQADGGTEMEDALTFAFKSDGLAQDDDDLPQRLRQIVFMTDGSVGYEEALLARIKQQLGDNRLFTVGIGSAPNTWFLDKAAEAGRGLSLSIRNEHDVGGSITQLLSRLANPVLTDIAVQYTQGQGEIYPSPLPDLYADRPGMWISRISDEVEQIVVTGQHGDERYREVVKLPVIETTSASISAAAPAVAMHWTRSKIDSLLDQQRYAIDDDLHKQTITQLAMDAGLVTKYTSFVAVEQEPVRPHAAAVTTHKVANLLPEGNEMMMSIAMPQGAAGTDTLAFAGALLGLGGIGLCGWARARIQT